MGIFSLFGKKTQKNQKGFYPLMISKIDELNSKAVAVEFNVPEELKTEFNFDPGQYVTLLVTIKNKEHRRSYSICSHPDEPLRIAIKRVENGIVSNWMNDLKDISQPILVAPPTGNFTLPKEAKKIVLIAAGSGITPILSILKANADEKVCTLIYGNKTLKEALFIKDLSKLPLSSTTHFLSRESSPPMREGRINKESLTLLIKETIELLKNDCFLICGPEEMIHSSRETLQFFGVSDEKIRFELFTAPVKETKDKKPVSFSGSSTVTVIVDDDAATFELSGNGSSLLDATEEEGLDAPYSCRGGVCCSCKAKIMEGSAAMDLNYSLSDQEVKDGYILTCQAHPTSEVLKISFDE
jgi:ring-1,2-phenylacetyl-CoA epoxidase subunit PaaE